MRYLAGDFYGLLPALAPGSMNAGSPPSPLVTHTVQIRDCGRCRSAAAHANDKKRLMDYFQLAYPFLGAVNIEARSTLPCAPVIEAKGAKKETQTGRSPSWPTREFAPSCRLGPGAGHA